MKSLNGMAERYRGMLAQSGLIELVGCHDVLSGMLAEGCGFKTLFLSGYGVAASSLGNPDIGLTTQTETSWIAKNFISRVNVPVVVDIDNGYGNEDNVIRTIREMEMAGAASVIMEDQVLPKKCGHTAGKRILPLKLYMRKLEFAMKNRETPLVIVARTDASDTDDAIERARTFHAAGADLTLIDGVRSVEALTRIATEVPGHKQVNLIYGGATPVTSALDLYDLGFKVVLYSTPTLFLVVRVLQEMLPKLRESHDLSSLSPRSVDFAVFQRFLEDSYTTRYPGVRDDEEHTLRLPFASIK